MIIDVFDFYSDLMNEDHILIAGTTGSGKSVIINGFIKTAMLVDSSARFYLIDPQKVELVEYNKYAATAGYADTPKKAVTLLKQASQLMDNRYEIMRREGLSITNACNIFIVIDGLAILIENARKQLEPLLTRISQRGRAAKIHLVMTTHSPTSDFLPPAVRENLSCRIALRYTTAIESRNIIDQKGAETLPKYGECYKLNSEGLQRMVVPLFEPPKELFR